MTNYTLNFRLEDTSFSTDERLLPSLRFSLEYTIDFEENEAYTFKTPINFNPKTKALIYSEYTFGKGFSYSNLLVEQLWNIHNPLKSTIVQPEEQNLAGNWLSNWHGDKATDSDKKKLETFTLWWKANFDSINEEIVKKKEEYNQQIVDMFSHSLID